MDEKTDDVRVYAMPAAILLSAILVAGAMVYSTNSISVQLGALEAAFKVSGNGGNATPTPVPAVTATPGPQGTATPAPSANIDVSGRPIRGNASAKVTIVAFSDFQCPYCSRAEATVEQIMGNYSGKVRYIHMNFPLSFHNNAQKAAEAFECAADQGADKAYALNDKMFANQNLLDVPNLKTYAAAISGMNAATFNSCLDGSSKTAIVAAQEAMGSANDVSGTPTFFINGKQIVGAQPYSAFAQLIDAALAAS